MSGEAFEQAISLLLKQLGFEILTKTPLRVTVGGEVVGDLDVVVKDPETGTHIGIQCKDWSSIQPGSKEFTHFVFMLKVANLKYGIFASRGEVASTLFTLADKCREEEGINVVIMDNNLYEKLWEMVIEGNAIEASEHLRLLLYGRRDIEKVERSKITAIKKEVVVENALPLMVYVEKSDIIPDEMLKAVKAKLSWKPYLFMEYEIYDEIKKPKTGEVLDYVEDEGLVVIDAYSGKVVSKDSKIYDVIKSFYEDVIPKLRLKAENYELEITPIQIRKHGIISSIKTKLSRKYVLKAEYETASGETKVIRRNVRENAIKIKRSGFVYLPVWHVEHVTRGKYRYEKIYVGCDGTVIKDETKICVLCGSMAVAICNKCFAVVCRNHAVTCLSCGKTFCSSDSVKCNICGEGYCLEHDPGYRCYICGAILCEKHAYRCASCGQIVGFNHVRFCDYCGRPVCVNDVISKRKMLIKVKHYCSEQCMILDK